MHGATDPHGLSCDRFILKSTKKTNLVLQSASGKLYHDPLITVNGQILIYLTNSSTREAVSPEQCALMTRTAKASMEEYVQMYKRNETKIDTKLRVYMAQSTLLCAPVAWLLYQHHSKRSPCLLNVLEKTVKIKR